MKNKILIFLLSIFCLSCSGDKKNLPESFDYGTIAEGSYTNDYFNLKLSFPKDWVVVEGEELERIQEAGREFAAGDKTQLKKVIKASEVNSAQILSIFKYEVGAPVKFNQNIQVVVENIMSTPAIETGKDYLFNARNLLTSMAMDIELVKDITTLNISGKKMDGLIVTNTINGLVIKQTYLAMVKNGFCINFVLSYIDDEQRDELYDIIGNMDI